MKKTAAIIISLCALVAFLTRLHSTRTSSGQPLKAAPAAVSTTDADPDYDPTIPVPTWATPYPGEFPDRSPTPKPALQRFTDVHLSDSPH